MERAASLCSREAIGELECVERHGEAGVPKAFEGKDQDAHGVNGFKIGVYDNTAFADFRLLPSASVIERATLGYSKYAPIHLNKKTYFRVLAQDHCNVNDKKMSFTPPPSEAGINSTSASKLQKGEKT